MDASVGRNVRILKEGVAFAAGTRTKSFTLNNNPVDITSDDDDGFRRLLEESAERQLDISLEGVLKGDEFIGQAVTGTMLITECSIVLPSGSTIIGDFRFNTIEMGAPYNDAVTFSATVQSTGEFSFEPATA